MAIEYLYNCIRATAGQDICVCAEITDEQGVNITEGCGLVLHLGDEMVSVAGTYEEITGVWEFTIPASATEGKRGRHTYCFTKNGSALCFREPIYLL